MEIKFKVPEKFRKELKEMEKTRDELYRQDLKELGIEEI